MTPEERAKRAIIDSDLEECVAAAVRAGKNTSDLRLEDAKQALNAALETLARVTRERDGLAARLADAGDRMARIRNERDELQAIGEDSAAHDRAVAARVLRNAASAIADDYPEAVPRLVRLMCAFERGEREVPGE